MSKVIEIVSAEEAVKAIKSGDNIHISSVATTPLNLIDAMVERGRNGELKDVVIHHIHTEGAMGYAQKEFEGTFQLDSFFVGGNVRKFTQSGYADYIPAFLNDTPRLYDRGEMPCDVVLMQCSEPDEHGYVSMGTSVDLMPSVLGCKPIVIASINKYMPRTFGDGFVHLSEIDYLCRKDEPLHEVHSVPATPEEELIGRYCAELIEDGACLQMGIGSIPNAVLSKLTNHKNLGIHTEMCADGVLPLIESGIVTGANKGVDKGKVITTFCLGSKKLYDFTNNNPGFELKSCKYTNDPFIISKNPKTTSINSAVQIDLTGQVCADSIGMRFYSGVGGQVDFVYGSSRSEKGISMIALQSVTNKGISKIAPILDPGAGVVTSRPNVHYIVTEYGAVNLRGKSLQERSALLTSIAHPDHRETLEKATFDRFGPHYTYVKARTLQK
ncbi:MAG: acetyl-CoA hydrolase/transferase family protein [Bacteroidetes bacterium]|nr:acetyl-CoA hydrolase/transferase family protein [Bacteroidota bacterium]